MICARRHHRQEPHATEARRGQSFGSYAITGDQRCSLTCSEQSVIGRFDVGTSQRWMHERRPAGDDDLTERRICGCRMLGRRYMHPNSIQRARKESCCARLRPADPELWRWEPKPAVSSPANAAGPKETNEALSQVVP